MGYGGQTVNGLSSLGPKMGKASGGGVKLDRKSIGKLTQSEDDVFSGKETQMENDSMAKAGVVSGSHSGNFMATPRYKSNGTSKTAKTMVKGPDGKPVPDYAFDKKGKNDLSKAPGKFDKVVLGGNKGDESKSKPGKTDYKK